MLHNLGRRTYRSYLRDTTLVAKCPVMRTYQELAAYWALAQLATTGVAFFGDRLRYETAPSAPVFYRRNASAACATSERQFNTTSGFEVQVRIPKLDRGR
jgi:hypothetical protein